LTGLSTARCSDRSGRYRIPPDTFEVALLVENRPGDAGELVGERNRQHVVVQSLLCRFDPRFESIALPMLWPELDQHDPGRLHKQDAQVAIATLRYLAEDGAVTRRYLLRHQPEPGTEVAPFGGSPITVRALNIANGPLIEPFKLGTVVAFTEEISRASVASFESIVRQMLVDAASLALDSAILSATAASPGLRPAGILAAATAIPGTTGGGANAIAADVTALLDALSAAGAGRDVVFIGSPSTIGWLKIWAGPRF
jgi:Phage capsid family